MRDKQGKLWQKIKKQKIEEFSSLGIVRCEMCNGQPSSDFSRQILDFAHSKKRRKIVDEKELAEVALLCRSCHNYIEYQMTHDEMEQTVKRIIEQRSKEHDEIFC